MIKIKSACNYTLILLLLFIFLSHCDGSNTFGFDIHHRYSEQVKGILDTNELPQRGTVGYYSAMAHRDRGRKLTGVDKSQLTFFPGNETYQLTDLGFLHYANVSVGTPGKSYFVALDTGSDLFWLPCDCISCVRKLRRKSGDIYFNIYSPNASSTSSMVSCSSSLCEHKKQCSLMNNDTCPYEISYLSDGTSSTGLLIEDSLHLITNNNKEKAVDARITLGCGMVETGSFLDGAAPNGLFGLGMNNISVPSILASEGLAANSFSMCFGSDGAGRISFGDKGSSGQGETRFNTKQRYPTYNISVTTATVGDNVTDSSFTAIFDTGTSFTYLNDPAYTEIAESFNSQVQEKRHANDSHIPFNYCYNLDTNQDSFKMPPLILTMQGGKEFNVTDPIIEVTDEDGSNFYCLALIKSEDVNIIGQNFMTGYKIVFDREDMVLGWEQSNCYDIKTSNTLPISPSKSQSAPPPTSLDPEATSGSTGSKSSPPPASSSSSLHTNHFTLTLVMSLLSLFIYSSDCILSTA